METWWVGQSHTILSWTAGNLRNKKKRSKASCSKILSAVLMRSSALSALLSYSNRHDELVAGSINPLYPTNPSKQIYFLGWDFSAAYLLHGSHEKFQIYTTNTRLIRTQGNAKSKGDMRRYYQVTWTRERSEHLEWLLKQHRCLHYAYHTFLHEGLFLENYSLSTHFIYGLKPHPRELMRFRRLVSDDENEDCHEEYNALKLQMSFKFDSKQCARTKR